jgi:hypothetical protein
MWTRLILLLRDSHNRWFGEDEEGWPVTTVDLAGEGKFGLMSIDQLGTGSLLLAEIANDSGTALPVVAVASSLAGL